MARESNGTLAFLRLALLLLRGQPFTAEALPAEAQYEAKHEQVCPAKEKSHAKVFEPERYHNVGFNCESGVISHQYGILRDNCHEIRSFHAIGLLLQEIRQRGDAQNDPEGRPCCWKGRAQGHNADEQDAPIHVTDLEPPAIDTQIVE